MPDGGIDAVAMDASDDSTAVDDAADRVEEDGLPLRSPVVALIAGRDHSCGLRMDGSVWCLGGNDYGQLGVATMAESPLAAPVMRVANVDRLPARATYHTCARRSDGTAMCWGLNVSAQLGDGLAQVRLVAVEVTSLTDAAELAIGSEHTCGRRTNGTVWCWGLNTSGQIGDATQIDRRQPVAVSGLDNAMQIAAGENFTCARRRDNYVVCWGQNHLGQLGDSTSESRARPVRVAGLTDAIEIAAGGAHSCARRMSGSVVCWGSAARGQLGGTAVPGSPLVTVEGLTDAVGLALGEDFSCARRANGTVVCWGDNLLGQLGTGTTIAQPTPGPGVMAVTDAVQITAGFRHACALRADATVACWGSNLHLQLGDRTIGGSSSRPVTVAF